MLQRIIAGCDGFAGGRDAAALAARLAAASGAELTLVTVHADPPAAVVPAPAADAVRDEIEANLRAIRDELAPGARVQVVADAWPARGLRRAAAAAGGDLIVVGSSHHSAIGRVLAGDKALQLLEDGVCAVAVAPRGYRTNPRPVRTIIAAFDGSPEARAALALARELADRADAKLRLHVVADARVRSVPVITGRFVRGDEAAAAELVERRRHAEGLLARALAELGGRVEGEVVTGDPADELALAGESADLLVVGSHRRTRLGRVALGATSAALLREAPCPVLVVPGTGARRPPAWSRGGGARRPARRR